MMLLLAGVFTVAVWLPFSRKLRLAPALLVAVAALSGVWGINFFVVLPTLNPVFITLMPYGITLISKMLFGIAMAWGLAYSEGLFSDERKAETPTRVRMAAAAGLVPKSRLPSLALPLRFPRRHCPAKMAG